MVWKDVSGCEFGLTEYVHSLNATRDTAVKRTGIASVRFNPSGAQAYIDLNSYDVNGVASPTNDISFSTGAAIRIRTGGAPAANTKLCLANLNSNSAPADEFSGLVAYLVLTTARKLQVWAQTGFGTVAQIGADSPVLDFDRWYFVEFRGDNLPTNNGATLEARIDEAAPFVSSTTVDLPFWDRVGQVWWGSMTTTSVDINVDDMYYRSDSAFAGIGQLDGMFPDGAGATTQWISGTGSSFAEIDDWLSGIEDDDATYIKSSGSAQESHFTLNSNGGIAAGSVGAVKWLGRAKDEAGATGQTIAYIPRNGGSDSATTVTTIANAAYVMRQRLSNLDPSTGLQWTKAGLDTAQVVVRTNGGNSDGWRVTAIGVGVWSAGFSGVTPSISGVSVSYSGLTRTGPDNTPWRLGFTASDADTPGANALNWKVYTGALRTGTLVASGTCTSGTPVSANIAYNASGLVSGNQTLYLSVDDGALQSADSSFTLKRDDVAAGASGINASHADENKQFAVTFTPTDAISTDANELFYEIRDASGGAGTAITSGTATAGVVVNSALLTYLLLADGSTTLYVRLRDGAGNWSDTSFTVEWSPVTPTPEDVSTALGGGAVIIFFRYEQRTNQFGFVADLSEAILDADITLDNNRAITRTASFKIDPQKLPASFNVRTSNITVNGSLMVKGAPVLFTLGTFRLDVANEEFSPAANAQWDAEGADLTVVLQQARVSAPYTLPAGSQIVDAVRTLCNEEGLSHNFAVDASVMPIAHTWDAGTSKLTISNYLMESINWFPVFDESGRGIMTSRVREMPHQQAPGVVYTTVNAPRMVIPPFKRVSNVGRYPNRVTAKIEDPSRALLYASLEDTDPNSPNSTANRPLQNKDFSNALYQNATLLAQVAEYYARDTAASAIAATLLTTFDPRRKPHESYTLHIGGIEDGTLWRVRGWKLAMKPGGIMEHSIGLVTAFQAVVVP